MYFKLALRNVRKSVKDYLIYFLTLAFSVCLFYMFNSFQDQEAVMRMNETQAEIVDMLSLVMKWVSLFVAIVLAFLILYANNFLIKRRKKELGLYMLLGMPKSKISRILVYETMIIGLLSLVFGLFAGFFLSQILTSVTANLFEVTLDYHFIFSKGATIFTIIAFVIIFAIIILLNTVLLNRYKLIDLLHAEQKIEELKIRNFWISLLLFVVSLACLAYSYHTGIRNGMMALNELNLIILSGTIGTILFFMSLAGFLLTFIQHQKGVYYKKLNCFVLKQINANINSNFLSMSIVCIMLLLSIGALSTGLNLNATMNNNIHDATPYDISYQWTLYYQNGSQISEDHTLLEDIITEVSIDNSMIKNQNITNVYFGDIMINDPAILQSIQNQNNKEFLLTLGDVPVWVVSLSDYNKMKESRGLEPLKLKNDELFLYTTMASMENLMEDVFEDHPMISIYGKSLKVQNDENDMSNIATTTNIGYEAMVAVINDVCIPDDATIYTQYWNINVKDENSKQLLMNTLYEQISEINSDRWTLNENLFSSDDVRSSYKGLSVIFTYIGLYLGIVFMIASSVILALQQLSQASDNQRYYKILSKIGADKRLLDYSIMLQIGIYFMVPLSLAIVHSIVGIKVVNNLMVLFGKGDIFISALFTSFIIILIYGAYYLVTALGYKSIVNH